MSIQESRLGSLLENKTQCNDTLTELDKFTPCYPSLIFQPIPLTLLALTALPTDGTDETPSLSWRSFTQLNTDDPAKSKLRLRKISYITLKNQPKPFLGLDEMYQSEKPIDSWLFYAFRHTHIKFLSSLGCDLNVRNIRNETPLYWAARFGAYEAIEGLLEAGADPNAKNDDGSTPLSWAIECGKPEIEKALLKTTLTESSLLELYDPNKAPENANLNTAF